MTSFEVYVWLMLDSFRTWIWIFEFLLAIAVLFCLFAWSYHHDMGKGFNDEDTDVRAAKTLKKMIAKTVIPFTVLTFIAILVPSSKQYALIRVLPAVINSDFAKEASGDARIFYDMAKEYMMKKMDVKTEKPGVS